MRLLAHLISPFFCNTILMMSIDLCELLYYTRVVALKFFKLNSNVSTPVLGAQTFDGISTSIIFLFHKNTQLDILWSSMKVRMYMMSYWRESSGKKATYITVHKLKTWLHVQYIWFKVFVVVPFLLCFPINMQVWQKWP